MKHAQRQEVAQRAQRAAAEELAWDDEEPSAQPSEPTQLLTACLYAQYSWPAPMPAAKFSKAKHDGSISFVKNGCKTLSVGIDVRRQARQVHI